MHTARTVKNRTQTRKKPQGSIAARLLAAGSMFPVRHRYVLTRQNRLRLRYGLLPALLLTASIGFMSFGPSDKGFGSAHASVAWLIDNKAEEMAAINTAAGTGDKKGREETGTTETDMLTDEALKRYETRRKRLARYVAPGQESVTQGNNDIVKAAYHQPVKPRHKEEEFKVGKGDSLSVVLARAGLDYRESYLAAKALEKYFDPRHIRAGQKLSMIYTRDDEKGDYRFSTLKLPLDPLKTVSVSRNETGEYDSELLERKAVTKAYAQEAVIEVSLFGSAAKAGIPNAVIAEAMKLYSWDVDFQRDIRKGDKIMVLYERYETEDGTPVKNGNVLYASLTVGGHEIPLYRFKNADGDIDYYKPDGKSARKTLMKTPIDGARISSGYGMRHHPVLGYSRMHKGMDFAAPTGTPIYAAGDGVIERASRYGAYGNYIRIRHNGTLKTAYAHLNGFAKGIGAGRRVKQGQVIGYVGTTGRSTGPHLHYEVLEKGTQVNPSKLKMPQGHALKGTDLEKFKMVIDQRHREYAARIDDRQDAAKSYAALAE